MRGARLRRRRDGSYDLRLPAGERDLLRSLPDQIIGLIESGDGSTRRLFPPAYEGDDEAESEYRSLVGHELLEHHRAAMQLMRDTADSSQLDQQQADAWLGALNDMRLVLGTRLDVTDDDEPAASSREEAPAVAVYQYLTALQAQVVEALAGSL